jgi:hypothetical protein
MDTTHMIHRQGEWLYTNSGKHFYPFDPHEDDICIEDIAHHLAHICRYTGACDQHYSVAQHSIHVSKLVLPANAMWGLLHDAPEAYVNDLARPYKRGIPIVSEIEDRIMQVIAKKYGLCWPMPEDVHHIVHDEAKRLFRHPPEWINQFRSFDLHVSPWPAAVAKNRFLDRFKELTLP